jgi:pimeloyl-ACP methyl ester carboxylesterase
MADVGYQPIGHSGKVLTGRNVGICCGILVLIIFLALNGLAYWISGQLIEHKDAEGPPVTLSPADAIGMRGGGPDGPWYWCKEMEKAFKDQWEELQDYNKKNGWMRIKVPSRPVPHAPKDAPKVTLDAYYFETSKDAKTIVVQHGAQVNNNDHTTITVGTMLRKMGYNVIMPSTRNHGNSTFTGARTYAALEAYDTLGAWDYIIEDPDGVLGVKKDPKDTALMGFSMGGLISTVAFALEPKIPSLLIDGAIWDAYDMLSFWFTGFGIPGFLHGFLCPAAWFFAKMRSGEDMDALNPTALLKKGDTRKISMVHDFYDYYVPFPQQEARYVYLMSLDFKLVSTWCPKAPEKVKADPKCTPHCEDHAMFYEKYSKFLCGHFSDVFHTSETACGGGLDKSDLGMPTEKSVVAAMDNMPTAARRLEGSPLLDTAAERREAARGVAALKPDLLI